jgi:uncharacterized protein YabN with tetrapyrrole methylase and pyrophosphatase domain
MAPRKGSLVVVGTGIESMGQLTPAARQEIQRAQRVFYMVADPMTEESVRSLNRRAVSLRDLYAKGLNRLVTYAQMVERVLDEVRRGLRVCLALYGHPGVFAMPAHASVTIARSEGYRATMLPAVSADACLIADLGVDPSTSGWQSYEATDFLLRGRRLEPTAGLVLWQVGVVGRLDYATEPVDREKIAILTERLLETYPRGHVATLYEAATLPTFPPTIHKIKLGALHRSPVTLITTMYVPPTKRAPLDRKMMARLGIRRVDHLRCLRAPEDVAIPNAIADAD